jgi:hypothetical protein
LSELSFSKGATRSKPSLRAGSSVSSRADTIVCFSLAVRPGVEYYLERAFIEEL